MTYSRAMLATAALKGAIIAAALMAAAGPARASMTVAETVNLRPDIAKSMCLVFKPQAQLAACDGSNGQKITMSRRDTRAAEPIMRVGDRCIEAGREGQALFLARCRNVKAQTWSYTNNGQIKTGDGLCVDVFRGETRAGTPVIAYRCTGQVNQRWARYDPAQAVAANAEVKQATLRPAVAPAKCLDMTSDGRLVVWSCHGGKNQKFTIALNASARIMVDGKCLAAPARGNGPVRGVACDTKKPEQFWTLGRDGTLKNRTGGCMDVRQSRTANGTELLRWDCTDARNQKFQMR